mmetsp:Transcript_28/g.106  ORF Transcript_28/g.106 Transcript_28/m.106 type:complete len:205 (-) Transcript_28:244-858(-)
MLGILSSDGNTTRCMSLACRPRDSRYLNLFRCSASTFGEDFTSMRLCASCKPPHASHWNLSCDASSSLDENCLRHALTLAFCSMSRLRSINASCRDVTFSHHKHWVWFVSPPSNISWIQVFTGLVSSPSGVGCSRRCCFTSTSQHSLTTKLKNSCASWCMYELKMTLSFLSRSMNFLGANTPVRFFWLEMDANKSPSAVRRLSS